MENLSFHETLNQINTQKLVLLSISMPNCSVCLSVKPRIEQLFKDSDVLLLSLDAAEAPEVAGTFQVMTAPAILVFYQGKEVHRQARFINFKQLNDLIQNYQAMNETISYPDVFQIKEDL
ncbi:thioredoxin family protein [Enterococcus sp. LJL98]